MHIAIVGSQLSIHTIRWANSLHAKGHSISLFSMHERNEKLLEGINLIKMPYKNPYGYILNISFLRKKLRSLNPDVVHSFYAFGYSFLARMSGFTPHLVSVLGSDIYDDINNPIYRKIIKKNITSADSVCSTSVIMKEKIKSVTGVEKGVNITPFGVDLAKFKNNNSRKNSDYDFVIGTVKKLENKYGIDTLLKAFALFCEKYPAKKFKLYLIGSGTQFAELKSEAKRLNIDDECDFVGRVSHNKVPVWLNKFDVFVALSRLDSESFGVSIIEASACELPVVVSDSGGLPEVVENGKTGIVVPKENPQKAFEAIDYLYQNQAIAEKMGLKGRERVFERYDWNASLKQMEDVYIKMIR